MRYLIFDDMTKCTDAEVERLLSFIIPQRREEVLRFKHTFGRFASAKTFEMLMAMMPDLDWSAVAYKRWEHGKPYLCDSEGDPLEGHHFNLSHSEKGLLVAVDEQPIGVDIQTFRPFSEALLRRCMNEEEQRQILSSEAPRQTFAALWTRKEAVVKLSGRGLTGDLHAILEGRHNIETHICENKGYAYSIALNR